MSQPEADAALRELAAYGAQLRSDGLGGELGTSEHGGVTNPANWEAIPRVAFGLAPDGGLRLEAPPALEGLWVDFRGAGSATQLVARIRHALRERYERVQALRDRLQSMGLKAGIDSARLRVVARVDLDVSGVVELEGGDAGLFVSRLIPALGDRTPLPLGGEVVDLDELPDRVDVELWVAQYAERALAGRSPAAGGRRESDPARRADKEAGPSLALLAETLGGDAVAQPGCVVTRSLRVEGQPASFTARLAEGSKLVARLSVGPKRLWEGEIELSEIGHLDEFVVELRRRAANGTGNAARPSRRQWSDADEEMVAGLLPPASGEVWLMDVCVEHEDASEVRYRGLNIAGKPSGATRVLPRDSFLDTFVAAAAGYRMLVAVIEVGADYVTYQTLDATRRAVTSPRRAPLIVFMANFTPESGL